MKKTQFQGMMEYDWARHVGICGGRKNKAANHASFEYQYEMVL